MYSSITLPIAYERMHSISLVVLLQFLLVTWVKRYFQALAGFAVEPSVSLLSGNDIVAAQTAEPQTSWLRSGHCCNKFTFMYIPESNVL